MRCATQDTQQQHVCAATKFVAVVVPQLNSTTEPALYVDQQCSYIAVVVAAAVVACIEVASRIRASTQNPHKVKARSSISKMGSNAPESSGLRAQTALLHAACIMLQPPILDSTSGQDSNAANTSPHFAFCSAAAKSC
jgi:hypothetical protein